MSAAELERLPAWATTGVGSLPYTEGAKAASQAVKAYNLPFCPQLPRLEGDMIAEWLDGDRQRPRAWEWLLRELRVRPPSHGLVKLQVTGPLTLARALEDASQADAIGAWLASHVAEQVEILAARGLDALVVVDEPGLVALAHGDDVVRAWDPLRAVTPAWGLHVCGAVPWDVVEVAAPGLISFDLRLGLGDAGAAAIGRLAARGTRIGWGVIAPDEPDADAEAEGLLDAALARTGVGGERSLLMPTCGTGRMTPRREAAVSVALDALAHRRRGGGSG